MKGIIRVSSPASYEYIELEMQGDVNDFVQKYAELREKLQARYQEIIKEDVKKEEW